MDNGNLIAKYNVPGPRYTSYPTVPYWDDTAISFADWEQTFAQSFDESNREEGISIYLHLPFCESLCTFCGCNKRITKNHAHESPYIAAILKEWKLYAERLPSRPKISEIHLGGGTPTFFKPEKLQMLIEGLFDYADRNDTYNFSLEGHPNNTTKAHLESLHKLGFRRVSYGVQDYDIKVQRTINRIQPFRNVKQTTDLAREIGYSSVSHDLIFGLPFQTLSGIDETVEKTKQLKPDRIAFYSYAHVPWVKGTGQRGYDKNDLPKDSEKRALYELGRRKFEEAGYMEIGMDHFALKKDDLYQASLNGKLHRNFMGYSSSKTRLMIGLGVSAISDSWYGFAQNEKKLESYYARLDANEIPIYRGHLLNREDLIIRRHILNLMCRFQTDWRNEKSAFPQIDQVKYRLREMEKDGIVRFPSSERLEVTDKGRPFIRNVCMAFDLRLHRHIPETQIFSMTV